MKTLLLAGTSDARRIAEQIVLIKGIDLRASFAGVTRQPTAMPCHTRIGGFGGRAGFIEYLRNNEIEAVIDATHPFASVMSARAASVCAALKLPHIQMLRPEWQAGPNDKWHFIAREKEAADFIPKGATVFLATGRQTLPGFENLQGRRLICRQIDPPDQPFPFENGQFLVGRPPFSQQDEVALFTELKIDWLVVKNSGGMASRTKLDAARALEIPVVMINRPPILDCLTVDTVSAVLKWLDKIRAPR